MRVGGLLVVVASLASGACGALLGFDDIDRVEPGAPQDDASATPTPEDHPDADAHGGTQDAEAGTDANTDAGATHASTSCPAPEATYLPPWLTPPARPKPCTSADVATFVNNEQQSFEAQKAAMATKNAACATCMFTREDDPVWGPITHTNDDRIFIGYAFCYRVAGASDGCATAAHGLEWCIQKVCNVCTSGQTLTDCRNAAETGTCKAHVDATLAACAGFEQILGNTCVRSGNVVGVLCGGT